MDSDGGDPVQLTHNSVFDGAPAFSPDGRNILFTGFRGGTRRIVMDADGGHRST